MSNRRTPQITTRKQPKQVRSNELVAAILEAAIQVLKKEGAARFTTARVAEKAGVSVGSVYQYFPNKAAILFRLQSDEWQQTNILLTKILENKKKPPLDRLRAIVLAFIQSECDEAEMRGALSDAAPLYRDAPEAENAHAASEAAFRVFMEEVLPRATEATRDIVCELVTTTLSTVGKEFSGKPRTSAEIKVYANAMSDMFCAYLNELTSK